MKDRIVLQELLYVLSLFEVIAEPLHLDSESHEYVLFPAHGRVHFPAFLTAFFRCGDPLVFFRFLQPFFHTIEGLFQFLFRTELRSRARGIAKYLAGAFVQLILAHEGRTGGILDLSCHAAGIQQPLHTLEHLCRFGRRHLPAAQIPQTLRNILKRSAYGIIILFTDRHSLHPLLLIGKSYVESFLYLSNTFSMSPEHSLLFAQRSDILALMRTAFQAAKFFRKDVHCLRYALELLILCPESSYICRCL